MDTLKINEDEFQLLRQFVEEQCGIAIGNGKEYLLESRLTNLVVTAGCNNFKDFYFKAKNDPQSGLRDKIVDAITTNETFWFRDTSPFMVFEELLLPDLVKTLSEGKKFKIRIWSAACSTGQEPYSLAMIIHKYLAIKNIPKITPNHFEILGTDISPSALFLALSARYDAISMSRGMDDYFKSHFFTQEGKVWSLKDDIKKMVTLKKINLQNDFSSLGIFDVIFCRNVAIYFSEDFKRDLFKRMARALALGGPFFIGSAEALVNYSTDFKREDYKKAIFYRTCKEVKK